MARVVALYRYPVKGFTPEPVDELTVQADGRIQGDRVLAFRFADALTPEQEDGLDYWPKAKGLALQDVPSLAQLALSYDADRRRLRIRRGDDLLADEVIAADPADPGRARVTEAVTTALLESTDAPRLRRPGRLPLTLVGDGAHARFQDRPRGFVSLHSVASVAAVRQAASASIDDRRFRSNIVVEGVDAWSELDWDGLVRIGGLVFAPQSPIVRCTATHANPDTGARDVRVLSTLTGPLGQREPTLGRLLLPAPGVAGSTAVRAAGTPEGSRAIGTVRVGDTVELTSLGKSALL